MNTNMNTIDNIQLEKDWNEAAAIFGELCKEGESILVGWIKSDDEKYITIYTIERKDGKLKKCTRIWEDDTYPSNWEYIYYP